MEFSRLKALSLCPAHRKLLDPTIPKMSAESYIFVGCQSLIECQFSAHDQLALTNALKSEGWLNPVISLQPNAKYPTV